MRIRCVNCGREYDISPWDDWQCYCGCSQFVIVDFGNFY